mgnify:CR=1 FL=1
MRNVHVTCEWRSHHVIEVPDDCSRFDSHELERLLDASSDDVTPHAAELVDWDITDEQRRS